MSNMNIEEIFTKQLTRNINGVVKAEQVDDESVFIELDEYVVTNELDRHFRSFFETYGPAAQGLNTDLSGKVGVWVSGFFGSGKSHFIKILSYLLENREVASENGPRKAIEFFKDKITDAMLYGDIHTAVSKETDVILFNIDSRANTDDRENAILKVFLKVFNERVGYCADFPHIAHMERELDKRRQYQVFKDKFAELAGSSWLKERDAYDFFRDEMVEAFAAASGQSVDSTRQTIDNTEANFPLDIANFCKWVKEYLDKEGDKNLLFLVDEVGQFIGKNTQMMLKLQTITENLGTICRGRAWVVVTSQADIDAAIGNMDKHDGDDFSKIQGRFATRLQLSSSNTSEVIQKRLLEKTDTAREALVNLFAAKGDVLKNQLSFDATTTAELKSYTDAPSFVDNYPFIPYHYPLVQKVFESIRTKGATGKHLAMGERSLLDAFQSAAKQIKDSKLDVLVPFYRFYEPIENFLEPAVKQTIDQAAQLDSLTSFDINILRTLFLIRYVDAVKTTLENLVTLSVNQIDTDKINLKKSIEETLNRLERQLLIARNGDEYIFLTNEEKEIENEIRHTDVATSEISSKLSSIIFDDLLRRNNTYRYPVNKQDFKVSRFCNGHPKDGSMLEDLVVKLVSPLDSSFDSYSHDQHCMNYSSDANGCVLVKLGENQRLWDELATFIKTERFLNNNFGQRPDQEHLLREKQMENIEREKRLCIDFESLFAEADVFAIGAKLPKKSSTPANILEEAYKYVMENTFSKLKMLRPTPGEALRELQSILNADDIAQLGLDMSADDCNPDATREVELYIELNVERNQSVYLRDIVTHFTRRPFGWPDNEILILTARLALGGKIGFSKNGAPLNLKSAYDTLTSVKQRGDIRVTKIRQHGSHKLKQAAALLKSAFNITFTGSSEKELAEKVISSLQQWSDQLKLFKSKAQTGQYPGLQVMENGLALIAGLLEQTNSFSLIERFVEDGSSLEDLSEDYEDLENFYNSQFETWQTLLQALNIQFASNRSALIKDKQAEEALMELERIQSLPEPYNELKNISPLIEQVQDVNERLIGAKREHCLTKVEQRIERVEGALEEAGADSNISNQALMALQQCKTQISTSSSIAEMIAAQTNAEEYENDAELIVNNFIESQRVKVPPVAPAPTPAAGQSPSSVRTPPPPVYVKQTISFSPANAAGVGFIETEQQVDTYLNKLREQMLVAVKAGNRIRIK